MAIYLPSLGYVQDDAGEVGAIELLLRALRRRRAAAAMVNILPSARMGRFRHCADGATGCTTRARTSTASTRTNTLQLQVKV